MSHLSFGMPAGRLALIGALVLVVIGAFWFFSERAEESALIDLELSLPLGPAESTVSVSDASPFTVQTNLEPPTPANTSARAEADFQVEQSAEVAATESLDVTALGYDDLSDEQLLLIVAQIKNDPLLLQRLIDEFRQETDADRLRRLADMLALVGGDQVTLLASELVFSGDASSRQLGLSLLRELQPDNEEARDIVSSMLSTEVEPDVLTSTLSALARPGDMDDFSRGYLSSQISLLTTHQDPAVRGVSLDILSRWNNGDEYAPVLLDGLNDSESTVRTAAGYALARYSGTDPEVIRRLLQVVNDNSEQKRARRAAILALKSMPLTQEQRDRVLVVERRLDRVQR